MKKKIMWHLAGRKTWTQTSNAVTVNSLGVWPVTRHALGLCIGQVGREIPWIGQWSAACCPSAPPGFPPPARSGPPRGRTSAPCRPSSRSGCGSPSSWSVCMKKGHKWEQLYIMITMLQVLIKCLLHSQSVRKMGNKEEQVYRMPTMLQVLMMCLLYGQTVWKGNRCEKTTANDNMFQAIKMYKIILLIGNQWVCQQCFSV